MRINLPNRPADGVLEEDLSVRVDDDTGAGMAQSVLGGEPEGRTCQERVSDRAESRHRGLPPGTGLSDTIAALTPGSRLGPVSRTDSGGAFDLVPGILAYAGPQLKFAARAELV